MEYDVDVLLSGDRVLVVRESVAPVEKEVIADIVSKVVLNRTNAFEGDKFVFVLV